MINLGACANCGSDILLVYFDAENGCRFCIGCGRRGPDAPLVAELSEEPTVVDFTVPEEITRIGAPTPKLIASARKS